MEGVLAKSYRKQSPYAQDHICAKALFAAFPQEMLFYLSRKRRCVKVLLVLFSQEKDDLNSLLTFKATLNQQGFPQVWKRLWKSGTKEKKEMWTMERERACEKGQGQGKERRERDVDNSEETRKEGKRGRKERKVFHRRRRVNTKKSSTFPRETGKRERTEQKQGKTASGFSTGFHKFPVGFPSESRKRACPAQAGGKRVGRVFHRFRRYYCFYHEKNKKYIFSLCASVKGA